jgi:hypothetical protein
MIDIYFELVGSGWFRTTFDNGDDTIILDPSHLTDAPLFFIEVLIKISEQSRNEAFCTWQDEPGEVRLLFKNEGKDLTLQVLHLHKNFSKSDNDQAQSVFSGKENRKKFVRKVLREFEKIKMEYPDIEYKDKWGFEFPTQALNRLRISVKD